eukprot:UN22690
MWNRLLYFFLHLRKTHPDPRYYQCTARNENVFRNDAKMKIVPDLFPKCHCSIKNRSFTSPPREKNSRC